VAGRDVRCVRDSFCVQDLTAVGCSGTVLQEVICKRHKGEGIVEQERI